MINKRANELMVVSMSASTFADLEDVVNDWLKDQRDHVIVHDISFEYMGGKPAEYTAWVTVTHETG
ncbi:MAG: hypothetical protein JSV77_10545 [Dehalococcoidales bacterium]|nr:MAG: hypothetical protein JSV77_10545 [Dehalococcoidales bacterium]